MIDGVVVKNLRVIPDERGAIMHMLRADDELFEKFGEIYFSTAYPDVIKGWHLHTKQTQNYCVVMGMIKLVLFDQRLGSITEGKLMELFVGDKNYQLVKIPPGVVNGYKCIGNEVCMVANCSTLPHEAGEMERIDPFGTQIPYKWNLVMK